MSGIQPGTLQKVVQEAGATLREAARLDDTSNPALMSIAVSLYALVALQAYSIEQDYGPLDGGPEQ